MIFKYEEQFELFKHIQETFIDSGIGKVKAAALADIEFIRIYGESIFFIIKRYVELCDYIREEENFTSSL